MTNTAKIKYVIFGICAVTFLVFIDQLTKGWAVHTLKNQTDIYVIPGVFQLHYLENYGAAFGLFQYATRIFVILTALLLCFFAVIYWKLPLQKRYLPLRILMIFFIAGAIGNFIDRLSHAYVVDFLYFSLIDFPVFNVADIYVTSACIVFAVFILFYYKEDDFSALKKER